VAKSRATAPTANEQPEKTEQPEAGISQAAPGSTVTVRAAPVVASTEVLGSTRVVTLELLRHGPDHNQLLSPLTPYLALCGNRDPVTFHVGFEHLHLLRRIQMLRYESGVEMASVAQSEAAEEVTRLLGSIQPLTAELINTDPAEEGRMVHLRVVLSASELALLPFELANSLPGLPGQKQPLCLQTVSPVCLTREVRRVAAVALEWPRKVRILVISAAPPPVAAVPLREHLQALRTALAPYMVRGDDEEFARFVTVLPEASLAAIREACRDNREAPFTHVHVLAHGISADVPGYAGARYGLAFHSEHNPNEVDIVGGTRLAAALRCHTPDSAGQEVARPVVLTIASCDSANMGTSSVLSAGGASIAHELHEAGIPLVIGSQFPLSVTGSVVMARLLYQRLLQGHDPRKVIHDLRQALYAEVPEAPNDWAAIVVYAAFPADLPAQLTRVRFERARLELDTAMARLDAVDESEASRGVLLGEEGRQELRQALKTVMKRLRDAMPSGGGNEERIHALGVLASAGKQVARFLGTQELRQSALPAHAARRTSAAQRRVVASKRGKRLEGEATERERRVEAEFLEALSDARRDYYACYQAGNIDSWPLVQYLALTVRLEQQWNTQEFKDRWTTAVVMSRDAEHSDNLQRRLWALSALTELRILQAAWDPPEDCWPLALQHIDSFYRIINLEPYKEARFDAYSLLRQVRRYDDRQWGTEAMFLVAQKVGRELEARGALPHWTRTS
jgi:hypothetical protein